MNVVLRPQQPRWGNEWSSASLGACGKMHWRPGSVSRVLPCIRCVASVCAVPVGLLMQGT